MMVGSMQTQSPSLNTAEFAAIARALATASRRLGLVAPGFRCPPRIVGVDRTLRRFGGDSPGGIVAVALKDRPLAAVVADMIEGVVVLNRLAAADATRARSALWLTLEQAPHDAHVA
ncbi:MAG: hypothetical protein EBR06_01500 [Acidimicrobiia bacterium]|jgi:hypothetical protein|nr:hypothetical protein [Acidimicrobiia bacterium]